MPRSASARSSSDVFTVSRNTTRAPDGERQQQVGHLRERVEERQHAEHASLLVDTSTTAKAAVALGQQVAVGEHDALGSLVVPEV